MMERNLETNTDSRMQNVVVLRDSDDEDLSVHHRVPLALQDMDWDDLTDMICQMDFGSINHQMRKKVRRNQQLLLFIRQKLKRNKIILRPSYKGDSVHAFRAEDLLYTASNYMTKMGIYILFETLNEPHPETKTHTYLANIVDQVETILDDLYQSKNLNHIQYTSMMPNRSNVQFSYLYFVPDMNEEELLVRPIVVCNNGPTMYLSNHLARLLWAMFDRVTHCQKFSQGADAVQALELYAQQNLLYPTTLFVSFTMDDICTVFPHQEILEALAQFLHSHASSDEDFQQAGMTTETILRLVRLVLNNQYFVYNNKLYRQTAGGASGSPLTMPLAYIYFYHWKLTLISATFQDKQEIFGRHLDEAFLTWNGSENSLRILFDMTTHQYHHSSMRIPISIGSTVSFDDVYLSHHNGRLITQVYHRPAIHQTTSLNIPSFPICTASKSEWKRLTRAARSCSNFDDFNTEQSRILYGLSIIHREECIQQFCNEFGIAFMSLPLTHSNGYNNLRLRVIEYQKQQTALYKQRKLNEKNTLIFRYAEELDTTEVAALQHVLESIYKEYCQRCPEWKQISFKLMPLRGTPLTLNDYLVEKRPPLRLLTLPKTDIDKNNDGDDVSDDDSN